MRICYIKQAENIDEYINYTNRVKNIFIKKIIEYYKKILKIITVRPIGESIILYIPSIEKNKIKMANKVYKKLKYYNIDNIVIENKLQIDDFKNSLYENNINILNGRWLFNYLLIEILEYIVKVKKENLENQEISILVNDLNEININNIYQIAEKTKRLNIVTNNIGKLKNIENKLYNEKGIMVTVSNNKRKSLLKAKIILNIDFPEDVLNKYSINKKAVLVNIEDKININTKSFNGININYYSISENENVMKKFKSNNIYTGFDKNILYESLIYDKVMFHIIKDKINNDNVVIKGLIGNNGIINEKEFEKSLKNT
ncbi:MAG: hypothetical protein IKT41_03385 [Clostridia bacterium]|nr:hypothetical protein [Clostridia bacterium]